MSQHDFDLANASGRNFREDANNALLALITKSAASVEPPAPHPFMWWMDTTGAYPILKFRNSTNTAWITFGRADQEAFGLKGLSAGAEPETVLANQLWIDTSGPNPILNIRNAANDAWIALARVDVANFGLLPLTGGSLSGPLELNSTDYVKVPVGTTAQRPGDGENGMIRYNETLKTYEAFREGNWGPIGGGQYKEMDAVTNLVDGNKLTVSALDGRQIIPVTAAGERALLADDPFGDISTLGGPTEVLLYNPTENKVVTLKAVNANDGCVGNFETIDIMPGFLVKCLLLPTSRKVLVSRG